MHQTKLLTNACTISLIEKEIYEMRIKMIKTVNRLKPPK